MLPRGPRGVVEGGLGSGDWYDLCVPPRWLWCTPVVLVAGVVLFRVLKSTRALCFVDALRDCLRSRRATGTTRASIEECCVGAVVVRSRETRD